MPFYKHLAVASTFSPTFLPVLAEAWRLSAQFECRISVIHASEQDEEKERRFDEAFSELGFEDKAAVLWSSKDNPVESIAAAVRENAVDLLVAGAVERQSEHRHFLGTVARGLMKELGCDLMLIPQPSLEEERPRHIVVGVDPREEDFASLVEAAAVGRLFDCPDLTLLAIDTPFARARNGGGDKVEEQLLAIAREHAGDFAGEIGTHVIESTTGFAACDFIQSLDGPFLVVGTSRGDGGRTLPPYMDWLNQVIPCRTLILSR